MATSNTLRDAAKGVGAAALAILAELEARHVPIYGDVVAVTTLDEDSRAAKTEQFRKELSSHKPVADLSAIDRRTMAHYIPSMPERCTPWSDNDTEITWLASLSRSVVHAVADRLGDAAQVSGSHSAAKLAALERGKADRFTYQTGHMAGSYIPIADLGGSISNELPGLDAWDADTLDWAIKLACEFLASDSDYRHYGVATASRIWHRPLDTAPGGPFFSHGATGHVASILLARPQWGDLSPPSDWESVYRAAAGTLLGNSEHPFAQPMGEIFGRTGQAKGGALAVGLTPEGPEPIAWTEGLAPRSRVVIGMGEYINSSCLPFGSFLAYLIKGRRQFTTDLAAVGSWLKKRAAQGSIEYEEDKSTYDQTLSTAYMARVVSGFCDFFGIPDWSHILTGQFAIPSLGPPFRLGDAAGLYYRQNGLPSGHLWTNFLGSLCNLIAILYACAMGALVDLDGVPLTKAEIRAVLFNGLLDFAISSDDVMLSLIDLRLVSEIYVEVAGTLGFKTDVVPDSRVFLRHNFDGDEGADYGHRVVWSVMQGLYAPENTDPAEFSRLVLELLATGKTTTASLESRLPDGVADGPLKVLEQWMKATSAVVARLHTVTWAMPGFRTHPEGDFVLKVCREAGVDPLAGLTLETVATQSRLAVQAYMRRLTQQSDVTPEDPKFMRWLGYIQTELGDKNGSAEWLLSTNTVDARLLAAKSPMDLQARVDMALSVLGA